VPDCHWNILGWCAPLFESAIAFGFAVRRRQAWKWVNFIFSPRKMPVYRWYLPLIASSWLSWAGLVLLHSVVGIVIDMQQLSIKLKSRDGIHYVPNKAQGFTIVELMAVLAIMSALLLIAAPSFVDTIKNSRMRSESYAMRASLANARSEALARRAPVIVCKSSDLETCNTDADADPWVTAHVAFVDDNNDGVVDTGELFLAREHNDYITVTFTDFNGDPASRVRFTSRGDSLGSSGTFTLCDDRGATEAGAVILNSAGDVRLARDSEDPPGDNIVNVGGVGGSNVVCP
jgi:type IV fimbrial biogenesis protein FimT